MVPSLSEWAQKNVHIVSYEDSLFLKDNHGGDLENSFLNRDFKTKRAAILGALDLVPKKAAVQAL